MFFCFFTVHTTYFKRCGGHSISKTTALYTHVSQQMLNNVQSPIDLILSKIEGNKTKNISGISEPKVPIATSWVQA